MLLEKIEKITVVASFTLAIAYLVKQGDIFEAFIMCPLFTLITLAWIDDYKEVRKRKNYVPKKN